MDSYHSYPPPSVIVTIHTSMAEKWGGEGRGPQALSIKKRGAEPLTFQNIIIIIIQYCLCLILNQSPRSRRFLILDNNTKPISKKQTLLDSGQYKWLYNVLLLLDRCQQEDIKSYRQWNDFSLHDLFPSIKLHTLLLRWAWLIEVGMV